MTNNIYFFDEYISMLAAKMVAEKGTPVLPSGLFYDNGIVYSYTAGSLIALVGFTEQIARWPTILTSVITIAVYYTVAKQLFNSQTAGVLAASIATFDTLSIIWGVRARMYAIGHLFVLLSLFWLLRTAFSYSPKKYPFLIMLALLPFSHTVTLFLLPPVLTLLTLFTIYKGNNWYYNRQIWVEIFLAIIILTSALGLIMIGKPQSWISLQDPTITHSPPFGISLLSGFIQFNLKTANFLDLAEFFLTGQNRIFLMVIILTLIGSLYRLKQRKFNPVDPIVWFLFLLLLSILAEMAFVVHPNWQTKRYLFVLGTPVFLLLSAGSLSQILHDLSRLIDYLPKSFYLPRPIMGAIISILLVGMIFILFQPSIKNLIINSGEGDYNTAFAYVRDHRQSDDKVMTFHPSAAYLYLGNVDYYANQKTAKVIVDNTSPNKLVDRYTASPLIDSVEELNTTLGRGHRVWFVVDKMRLFRRYDAFFTQQIFAQMLCVFQTGDVYVFRSRENPIPLSNTPSVNDHHQRWWL